MKKQNKNKSVAIDFKKAINYDALHQALNNEKGRKIILNILNKVRY